MPVATSNPVCTAHFSKGFIAAHAVPPAFIIPGPAEEAKLRNIVVSVMPIDCAAVTASTPVCIAAATFCASAPVNPASTNVCVPPIPMLLAAPLPMSWKNPPIPDVSPTPIGVQLAPLKNAPTPSHAAANGLLQPPAELAAVLAALVAPAEPAPIAILVAP